MAVTLRIESFADMNLLERSSLSSPAAADATTLTLISTEGFAANQTIYVGVLGREGCERAVIASVDDETTLTLTSGLGLAHSASEPVTGVFGDRIRIYRAPNVDDTVPGDDDFTVLATRAIDPDQQSTYYRDSSGSSEYWYRATYYNETSTEETSLAYATPFRGDEFAHYASLTEIRREAGFLNAHNLSDTVVDQQRRIAESEVNTSLGSVYAVPFTTVPESIKTVTIQLAAGLLRLHAFRGDDRGTTLVKDARARLAELRSGDSDLPGDQATSLNTAGVDSNFGDEERSFRIGDRF